MTQEDIAGFAKDMDGSQLEAFAGVQFDNDLDFKNAIINQIGRTAFGKNQNVIIEAAIQVNPYLILIGILGFIASFAVSLGPVMWVLLSEIFPTKIRGAAISVIGFANSTTSTLVTLVFPWQLENLGNVATFSIYIVFAAIGLILLLKLLPETKGKSLEELEEILVK